MTIEAMKQALEFIERVNKDGWILADFEPQMYEAIASLRQAIAGLESKEPVAWVCCGSGEKHDIDFYEDDVNALPVGTMLYTHPPQRTWVGLTDEELMEIMGYGKLGHIPQYARNLTDAIEAKLKEKNT